MKKITFTLAAVVLGMQLYAQKPAVNHSQKIDLEPATIYNQKSATSNSQAKGTNAVLNETFDAAIPANWGAAGATSNKWAISNTTEEGKATGATGKFAFYNAANINSGEASLVTPILQPVVGNNTLSFSVNCYKRYTSYNAGGPSLFVEFSTDNGANWTTSTTNILATLANYNVSNTGWLTQNVDLSAYNSQNVMVRFRAVTDYGWVNIGIDNVTGPNVYSLTNELSVDKTFVDINSFDYFIAVPNSQIGSVDYGIKVKNNGTAAQSNVTVHADVNNGAFTGATGLNNPTTSFASALIDTLWATATPSASTFTEFAAKTWITQTESDEAPSNNIADSISFYGTNTEYYRSLNFVSTSSSYITGTTAATGFEIGATYFLPNAGRIDSISTIIYHASGTGNVVGKIYSVDLNTGTPSLVAQTAPHTPTIGTYNDAGNMTNLALTTPYTVTPGSLIYATIQLNGNFTTAPRDTISIGSDNAFFGSNANSSICYLNVGGTFGWYNLNSTAIVGLLLQDPTTVSIKENNNNISNVLVFPNPAKNVLNIANAGKDANISIVNALGQLVFNTVANGNTTINTENLSEGVYFVRVNSKVSKVIISK